MFAKEKRGQISIFIIIGLVLLLAITIFFILQKEGAPVIRVGEVNSNIDFIEVSEHLKYCLERVSNEAVIINGMKGGLYSPQHSIYGVLRPVVTSFYVNEQVYAPTTEDVAHSIGLEFLDLMPICLDDFEGTTETLTYDSSKASVTVTILKNEITVAGSYPVTAYKDTKSQEIATFQHTVENVRLALILDLATELSYQQQADPGFVCVTCAVELADQHFMYIDYTDIGNKVTIYTFTDLFSRIETEPYIFVMAHEH